MSSTNGHHVCVASDCAGSWQIKRSKQNKKKDTEKPNLLKIVQSGTYMLASLLLKKKVAWQQYMYRLCCPATYPVVVDNRKDKTISSFRLHIYNYI
jgi:hypothetical protein